MSTVEKYNQAKKRLFDTLSVLDTYVDGKSTPQKLISGDWIEVEQSKGVFIKNITLRKPNSFAIALIHGIKGAKEEKHLVKDSIELYCISGKIMMNGIEFRPGDRLLIPADTLYSFEFLEDSYLTSKFMPKDEDNPKNFTIYENSRPYYPTTNTTASPSSETRGC